MLEDASTAVLFSTTTDDPRGSSEMDKTNTNVGSDKHTTMGNITENKLQRPSNHTYLIKFGFVFLSFTVLINLIPLSKIFRFTCP